jgi:hypothetical protein
MITVDSRAVTFSELELCVRQNIAQAQLVWVGFRHSSVEDPVIDAILPRWQSREPRSWVAYAEELFPESRQLSAEESAEIDATILRGAVPFNRSRRD